MKTLVLKRVLSFILVAMLVIGMLPVSAFATDDFYTFADGVLTITSDMPSYDDPSTAPWDSYRDQITKVVVQGSSVWYVGNNAFAGCTNLKQVVIDCESINSIGDGAFQGCTSLTDVDFGDQMTTIRPYAFADCTALTSVVIPTNIRYIGYGAFQGCSNLEDIYIYSRNLEYAEECIDEENYIYSNAATIPETTQIHCYPSGNANYFCQRNNRPYTPLTDGYAVSAEQGDSTYDIGFDNDYVTNLWAAAKAENSSTDNIYFDYDVSIDADILCNIHDGMVDSSNQKLFEGNNTSGELEVEVVFCSGGPMNSNSIRWYATYRFEKNDMAGNANEDYKNWVSRGDEPYVTFSSNGKDLNIHMEGSFAEMNARLQEITGDEFDPEYAYISIYCRGISHYRGSNGYEYDRKTTYIEGMSADFADVHNRNADCEPLEVITMSTPFTVTDYAPESNAGYWEPIEKNFTWNYRVTRYGAYLDELGRMLGDIQDISPDATEGTYLEEYDGITYGTVMGSYDAGSIPTACFRDVLTQDQVAFVESLAGLEPYGEYGQQVMIQLDCTLTLTYPDGTKTLTMSVAHEGTSFAGVCVHACETCGMCTADVLLACNTSQYGGERILECTCQEPAPALQISRVEASIGEANLNIGDPKVVVEQVDLEESGDARYLKNVFRMLSQEKTYAVFDISVLDGEMPYIPNQWGGNYEYLDITIPVTQSVMDSILSGDVGMYHIDADGNAETVDMKVDAENLTITVRCYQFSPYVLADTVSYYGRNALMAMENGEKYVYAYDQILFYINDNNYDEEVTIWVNDLEKGFTSEELTMILDVFRRDHPELFWIADEYRVVTDDDGLIYYFYLTMELMYEDRANAINAVADAAEQILSGITEDMSDYDKALYIHDALAAYITYEETENAHDIYGALAEGKAVCDGYAEAFQYLLREADIQSYIAVGTTNREAHAWNYVRIDGKYYHVDLTLDDQGENLFHAYFNQTDAVIQEDHTIRAEEYTLPECISETAQYFTGKDERLDIYNVDVVGQLLKDNGLKVHVYIPGNVNDFISWYQANIAEIGVNVGVTGEFSYGYEILGRELLLYLSAGCASGDHTDADNNGRCDSCGCTIPGTHEHTLTLVAAVEPTYTACGRECYYICECGLYFEDAEATTEIPDIESYGIIPTLVSPVSGWNLVLGDHIGVNLLVTLSAEDTVTASINGTAIDVEKADNGDGNYKLTLQLAAAQMTEDITVYVNGMELARTYSARGYADEILKGDYDEKTKELVRQMLTYGGAAQTYFGYNIGDMANSGITAAQTVPTGDSTVAISGNISGVSFFGSTLVFRSRTAVRFYFTADSLEGVTFTVAGKPVTPVAKDGMYYVEVADINPQDLANDVTVTVTSGSETLTVGYSPMDYIIRMYAKAGSSEALKALMQAFYSYHLAAVAYTAK